MIEIISATRMSEKDFWNNSALGISLDRLSQDRRFFAHIAFNNQRGLPEVFNARINATDGHDILVFIHDDVWIDDYFLADRVIAGLNEFDVIGVAGNRRRLPNQPSWAFIDTNLTWDTPPNLSGSVAHGIHPFGPITVFGTVPAECELLDGVFLAVKKSTLKSANVAFDPRFDFHFYDMDFCRSARAKGLRLGTWPICLTHQSVGAYKSPQWHEKYLLYQEKWMAESAQRSVASNLDQALQQAIAYHQANQLQEAEELYCAILQAQPNHPDTNHQLGMLAMQLQQPAKALLHFNVALQADPSQAQYWLTYIDALMRTGNRDAAQQLVDLGREHGLQEAVLGAMTERLGVDTDSAAQPPKRLEPNPPQDQSAGALPPKTKKKATKKPDRLKR